MILRLSQKLAKKIKAGTLEAMPLDENPYADWSCHLFTADRKQYIILCNTKSLYSCMMLGKGITGSSVFIERAMSCIREFMEKDGQAFVFQKFIAPASETVQLSKALNRSVTGSLNEFVYHAKMWLTEGGLSPFEAGLKLNDSLFSILATEKSRNYGQPNEAFKLLADSYQPGEE